MAGTLTINSSGDGSLLSGHSWLEYTPDGGQPTTYGTWGNDPMGLGNGLHENLEAGRVGDVTRTVHLDDAQEARLYDTINQYKAKGADGWEYLNPCSGFAQDAWKNATGETLDSKSYGVVSNPSKLKESIQKANAQPAQTPANPKRPNGSSKPVSSATQGCSNGGGGSSG